MSLPTRFLDCLTRQGVQGIQGPQGLQGPAGGSAGSSEFYTYSIQNNVFPIPTGTATYPVPLTLVRLEKLDF